MNIGEEFAVRWICKNHPVRFGKGKVKVDEIDLLQCIAHATNIYADKKRKEFEEVLRSVIVDSLDESKDHETISVSPQDFLESECMKFVASRFAGSAFENPPRFPVNLHS